jgi:hypothetical protein
MCGRYYNRRQKQQIAKQFSADTVFEASYAPDHNIAASARKERLWA